jgi:hypothetical protein
MVLVNVILRDVVAVIAAVFAFFVVAFNAVGVDAFVVVIVITVVVTCYYTCILNYGW